MTPIKVDMSKAKTLEPLPKGGPYLASVSAFESRESSAGNPTVHVELTIIEPAELAKKKLFDDISLENEYTLGRLQKLLVATEYAEDMEAAKKVKGIDEDKMIGSQLSVWVKHRESEGYGTQAQIQRVDTADKYSA